MFYVSHFRISMVELESIFIRSVESFYRISRCDVYAIQFFSKELKSFYQGDEVFYLKILQYFSLFDIKFDINELSNLFFISIELNSKEFNENINLYSLLKNERNFSLHYLFKNNKKKLQPTFTRLDLINVKSIGKFIL